VDGYSHTAGDVLYLFAIGRSEDDAVDFAVGANIDGTDVAATAAIATWADTAGGNKLFIRRIRTLLTDTTFVLHPFYTIGDRTLFETAVLVGTVSLTIGAKVDVVLPLPAEICSAFGRFFWVGPADQASLTVLNQFNRADSPSTEHTFTSAGEGASSGNTGQWDELVGPNATLTFVLSTGGPDNFAMAVKGFADYRGRVLA